MATRVAFSCWTLALTAFASLSALAEPPRLGEPALFETDRAPAARGEVLLYRLPSLFDTELPLRVRVEYRVDGELRAVERFDLSRATARVNAALDLLAYHPDTRAQLSRQSLELGKHVEVSIYLDGVLAEVLDFAALARGEEREGRGELQPLEVGSTLRGGIRPPTPADRAPIQSKGIVPDPACVAQCHNFHQACVLSYPVECANPESLFCPCNLELMDCVAVCPLVCVEPKSITPFTRNEVISSTQVGNQCAWSVSPSPWGYWLQIRLATVRRTTGNRIEACNGSITEQVLSVTYSSGYCLKAVAPLLSCYGATAPYYPICSP